MVPAKTVGEMQLPPHSVHAERYIQSKTRLSWFFTPEGMHNGFHRVYARNRRSNFGFNPMKTVAILGAFAHGSRLDCGNSMIPNGHLIIRLIGWRIIGDEKPDYLSA
jgi:hypothetical protein